jgi:hypothetical protein
MRNQGLLCRCGDRLADARRWFLRSHAERSYAYRKGRSGAIVLKNSIVPPFGTLLTPFTADLDA